MMRRHAKVLRRPDEDAADDGYRPRHLRDLRNTLNDRDVRDPPEAAVPPEAGERSEDD
ncbi:hypothetical protein [Dactylosporangium salmoneum]|uniref:Uncharacterized protein n=1 Tax=Dactylosporangium salmoneum TaxID=53361 RepID=A0ABN3FFI7_9ACTN